MKSNFEFETFFCELKLEHQLNFRVHDFFFRFRQKMGKSIRSKKERLNRSIRRTEIYSKIEDQRLERIVEKSMAAVENSDTSAAMEVEDATPKVMDKNEKLRLFKNRNQLKKKQKALKLSQLKKRPSSSKKR